MFLGVQSTKFEHWFRQGLGAEQATSHYLKQWCPCVLTFICVTRPQWFKTRTYSSYKQYYGKWKPGCRLNIKTQSYQYRNCHHKDKTVSRPSILYIGNPYLGRPSLYWGTVLVIQEARAYWMSVLRICYIWALYPRDYFIWRRLVKLSIFSICEKENIFFSNFTTYFKHFLFTLQTCNSSYQWYYTRHLCTVQGVYITGLVTGVGHNETHM